MEATRSSVTSGNENYYNMEPTYQTGYTQQEVEGKEILKDCEEAPFFVFHESGNGRIWLKNCSCSQSHLEFGTK